MSATGIRLEKALWTNIAELRIAETRRLRYLWIAVGALSVLLVVTTIFLFLR
jgi:hypothetical protein